MRLAFLRTKSAGTLVESLSAKTAWAYLAATCTIASEITIKSWR